MFAAAPTMLESLIDLLSFPAGGRTADEIAANMDVRAKANVLVSRLREESALTQDESR